MTILSLFSLPPPHLLAPAGSPIGAGDLRVLPRGMRYCAPHGWPWPGEHSIAPMPAQALAGIDGLAWCINGEHLARSVRGRSCAPPV